MRSLTCRIDLLENFDAYSRLDVINFLKSYGLESLAEVINLSNDVSFSEIEDLSKKILKKYVEIMSYKGSRNIINILEDIFSDSGTKLDLKNLAIVKKENAESSANPYYIIRIDEDDDNIFKQINKNSSNAQDIESFVGFQNDPYWTQEHIDELNNGNYDFTFENIKYIEPSYNSEITTPFYLLRALDAVITYYDSKINFNANNITNVGLNNLRKKIDNIKKLFITHYQILLGEHGVDNIDLSPAQVGLVLNSNLNNTDSDLLSADKFPLLNDLRYRSYQSSEQKTEFTILSKLNAAFKNENSTAEAQMSALLQIPWLLFTNQSYLENSFENFDPRCYSEIERLFYTIYLSDSSNWNIAPDAADQYTSSDEVVKDLVVACDLLTKDLYLASIYPNNTSDFRIVIATQSNSKYELLKAAVNYFISYTSQITLFSNETYADNPSDELLIYDDYSINAIAINDYDEVIYDDSLDIYYDDLQQGGS